jgi:hypothetical protein
MMKTTRRGFWGTFAGVFGVSALAVSEARKESTGELSADQVKCTCSPHPPVMFDPSKISASFHQPLKCFHAEGCPPRRLIAIKQFRREEFRRRYPDAMRVD